MGKQKKKNEKILKDLSELKTAGVKVEEKPKSEYLKEVDLTNFYHYQVSPISENREAKAPYNFIPLNDKIILSDFNTDIVPLNKYHPEPNRFTGYIQLKITTKTPVYVRDSYDDKQLKKLNTVDAEIEIAKNERNDDRIKELEKQKLWGFPDFFSPADGKLRIPGSSLRGLVRNMVEIISYGRFINFENKRLYFRNFADSSLRREYNNFGLSSFQGGRSIYSMKCGILKKVGLNYEIIESGSPTQIPKTNARTVIGSDYKEHMVYLDKSANRFIVVSGDMVNSKDPAKSKNNDWIVTIPGSNASKIKLDEADINDYKNDENRSSKTVDLLYEAEKNRIGIPCFYKEYIDKNKKKRIVFGHTAMFRVPYNFSIAEHLPQELHSENFLDISEAIFGNETKFAGRVFFEDAFCEQDKNNQLDGAQHPKILSGPKPTTFQHYLTQTSEDIKDLKHYNSIKDKDEIWKLSAIRGYKMYWHKSGNDWAEDHQRITERNYKQYTKINPVKARNIFTGRIRFENLSDKELGALLFALDLPSEKDEQGNIKTECCHKIGMGKPLGLGSIKINPTLHLSNRQNRYTDLFTEWTRDLDESNLKEDFKNSFATFILNQLNGDDNQYNAEDLWEMEDRMKELKKMLDFENKPDDQKTRYMKIEPKPNEFKNRPILPKPRDVI